MLPISHQFSSWLSRHEWLHVVRRGHLQRHIDATGVSGTGRVAGVELYNNGSVVVRWETTVKSITIWDSIDDALTVHGHGGFTELVWED